MTIITNLPLELWNIILDYSNHEDVKQFMYVIMVYKVFDHSELNTLKISYIYQHIVASSPLNKTIYSIYNNLDMIKTKQKYINYYSKIYYEISSLNRMYVNIEESLLLRNYLANKIESKDLKQKFENLTNKVINININCKSSNGNILKMLEFIN